jgi:protocatechuate 3,4-dioxygenase beta subunit
MVWRGPRRAERAKKTLQTAKGLRGDIKGRSLLAGSALVILALVAGGPAGAEGPPQFAPRDVGATPPATGTAVIRGRVVDAETSRPLRRARLALTAPELGREGLSASTDDEGRYELTDLPAGRFTLAAQRSGYLQLRYGQRRANEQGKPLELASGQVLDSIDFALPRMAVVSGRVVDELGDPIAGVWVTAQRFFYSDNRRRLMPDGPIATTDDDGEYRLVGLLPGSYVVNARTLEKWTITERGREQTMAYAPTFFPAVTDAAQASRIELTVGREVANIDIRLVPGRAATISGTAVDSQGRPLKTVSLIHELMGRNGGLVGMAGTGTVNESGVFEIVGVPPGEYKLQAPGPQESVMQPIVVNSADISGVSLSTSPGWTVRGNVVVESDKPSTLRRAQVTVAPVLMAGRTNMGMQGGAQTRQGVNDDWTFFVSNVVGAARLRVTVPEPWAVKAVLQADRDIADLPLDLKSGEELGGLQIVVTDRGAMLSGQLVDGKGNGSADGTVLLFPADSARWYEGSRLVRVARPDQQGRYRIAGVLPGEYLAAALDYVEEGIWNDPEFLASVRPHAQKVAVTDASPLTVSLKVVTP